MDYKMAWEELKEWTIYNNIYFEKVFKDEEKYSKWLDAKLYTLNTFVRKIEEIEKYYLDK
jgi:hypothetical protein